MAIDLSYIFGLWRELETTWASLHAKVTLIETMRHQAHKIVIPKAFEKTTFAVYTPYLGDIARRVNAILGANYPTLHVEPRGIGQDQQSAANVKERWTEAVLLQLERQAGRRIWRSVLDSAITYSLGIHKLVYWPDAWRKKSLRRNGPEDEGDYLKRVEHIKKGLPLPFVWHDVDPRAFFPLYDEDGLAEVLEVTQRPLHHIVKKYGLGSEDIIGIYPQYAPGAVGPAPNVTFLEHWTREQVSYAVGTTTGASEGNKLLRQFRHGYGRVPYFPSWGLLTMSRDPRWQGESIVEHILPIVQLLDNLLTMKLNWAIMASYPMGLLRRPEGSLPTGGEERSPESEAAAITFEPGAFVETDADMSFVQPPPVGKDLDDLIRYSTGIIGDYGGIVPVLRGIGGFDQPGYAIAQLLTAARQVFDPIVDNAALALEEMIAFMWRLIEQKVKSPIFVLAAGKRKGQRAWLSLGPEDIDGYYHVSVRIQPLMPTDKVALGQFGLQQVQAGAMSMRHHQEENLGLNADEMAEEVDFERLRKSPGVQAVIDQLTLEKSGLAKLLAAGGVAEAGEPPPVMPTAPLAPAPGLGMPLIPPEPPPGGPGGRAAGVGRQPPMGVPTQEA